MLAVKRVLKNYDLFLSLLKFSLRNAENPEFNDFSLITSYIQLLKDLECNIKGVFDHDFDHMESDYNTVLKSIFKEDLQDYKHFIDSDEKEELIRWFKFLIDLANCVIDREGEIEVDIIDKEFMRIKNSLLPLLRRLELR